MNEQLCSICKLPLENETPASVAGFNAVHVECYERIASAFLTPKHTRMIARAVRAYRRGTGSRWEAALAASIIVGRYERGATLSLARALYLSASQVENLAMAGTLYRWLTKEARALGFGVVSEVQRCRALLSISHWVALAEAIRRFNPAGSVPKIGPVDAMRFLSMAVTEGLTVIDFKRAIELECKTEPELAAEPPLDLGATDDVPRISDTIGQGVSDLNTALENTKKPTSATWAAKRIETMVRDSEWAGNGIARVTLEFQADELLPVGATVLMTVVVREVEDG